MPVQISRLPLAAEVRASVEAQGPLALEKRIEIKVAVPANLAVLADADLLPRVIQNLLDNAVKFTPQGAASPSVRRRKRKTPFSFPSRIRAPA